MAAILGRNKDNEFVGNKYIHPTAGTMVEVFKSFDPKAEVQFDNINIFTKRDKNGPTDGYTLYKGDKQTAGCREDNFKFHREYEEEIQTYKKATVGDLVDVLQTFPRECEILEAGTIVINNRNGVLNDRFEHHNPEVVKISYAPWEDGWSFGVYGTPYHNKKTFY